MSIVKNASISKIADGINNDTINTIEWNGNSINVVDTIDVVTMYLMIDYVMSICFDDEGMYDPRSKDYAIKSAIIQYYTDVETLIDEDSEERSKTVMACYNLIYKTDFINLITQHINIKQLEMIIEAINEEIEARIRVNADATKKLISKFVDIEEKIESLFDGIDNETITQISNAIAGGSFDEEKLINAIVNMNR